MNEPNEPAVPRDTARLDHLDISIRQEADRFLQESGLGRIVSEAGFLPVGSYAMRVMSWRDLDFERMCDSPSWDDHWALGRALAETGWVWRASCVDAYRDQLNSGDSGLYWGIRASNPSGGPMWKLDLWTARPEEFAPGLERRALWAKRMTEEARLDIIEIKEALCHRPDYRKTVLSVHIYEAVLQNQIRGVEAFWDWWHRTGVGA